MNQEKLTTKTMICKRNVVTELTNLKLAIKDTEAKLRHFDRIELENKEKIQELTKEIQSLIKYTGIELGSIKEYVKDLDKQLSKLILKVQVLISEDKR